MEKLKQIAENHLEAGIGSYLSSFVIIYLFVILFLSFYRGKDYKSLIGSFVDGSPNYKYENISNAFPNVTIPFPYYKQLTARQINAVLQSNSCIFPIDSPCFVAPYFIKKNSFHVTNCRLIEDFIYVDVEFELVTSIDVSLELYAGVTTSVYRDLGIVPRAATKHREIKDRGDDGNEPELSDNDIPMKELHSDDPAMNIPGRLDSDAAEEFKGCNIDQTCKLEEKHAMYVRKSFVNAQIENNVPMGRKVKIDRIPYCDFSFYKGRKEGIKLPADIADSSVSAEISALKAMMSYERDIITFMLFVMRSPDLGSSTKCQFQTGKNSGVIESLDFKDSQLIHSVVGVCKAEKEGFHFIVEHTKDLIYATRASNESSMCCWYDLGDMYGSTSSTSNLNAADSDNAEAKPQCVVCLSDIARICILPCRHLCMCVDCWQGQGQQEQPGEERSLAIRSAGCPVCRGYVKAWIELKDYQ